tara:strand:- start:1016 stop:1399 length:384 start_codon:yes stop_codon:yes gene_type:complete
MHEKPQIGSEVTVTTRWSRPSFYLTEPYEDHTLKGQVVSLPWLKPDQFAVKNPNIPQGVSVISLERVVALKSNKATIKLDSSHKEWTVTGSKGDQYLVIRQQGKYNCSCPGFQFRKNCRHVKEIESE